MFHLFKKESICVQAPISGTVIALEQVNDPTFAQKLMGDGLAIKPSDHTVCAPIEGELILVADTLHAFGIRAKDGTELLIHIGIDTVMLKEADSNSCISKEKRSKHRNRSSLFLKPTCIKKILI